MMRMYTSSPWNTLQSTKEDLTAKSLATAISDYLGSKAIGETLQGLVDAVGDENAQPQTTISKASQPMRVSISVEATRIVMRSLGYRWRTNCKVPYLDGHERVDVIKYRHQFVNEYLLLRSRFANWDDKDNLAPTVQTRGERQIVVVTHDESTFHSNDGRRFMWLQPGGDRLRQKGLGKGIMVSDFFTPGGRLACTKNGSDVLPLITTNTVKTTTGQGI